MRKKTVMSNEGQKAGKNIRPEAWENANFGNNFNLEHQTTFPF